MKMSFENLGVLHRGSIELGDFTLICGRNNTGKTYATYALYGFLKSALHLNIDIPSQKELEELEIKGSLEIDLASKIYDNFEQIQNKLNLKYLDVLPDVLAANRDNFQNSKIYLEIPRISSYKEKFFETTLSQGAKSPSFIFSKLKNSSILNIKYFSDMPLQSSIAKDFIASVLHDLFLSHAIPPVFMISTERTGATIFKNELNFTRIKLLDFINNLQHMKALRPELFALFNEFTSLYPLSVKDNTDFINNIDVEIRKNSDLLKENPEILDDFVDIIGGEYKIEKNGVFFQPRENPNTLLALVESSSSVRSLLILGLYLRHRAKKGDLLMIDEPELNLHPANQCRIARLLARLVNWGIKVFITTHSDYIAKEINTMILLSNFDESEVVKYGYKPTEILKSSQVKPHLAHQIEEGGVKKNILEPMKPLDDGGYEYPSFDDVIVNMNNLQMKIWEDISRKESVSQNAN
jgi:predicted ATP-dependent endonuclease of OLD family